MFKKLLFTSFLVFTSISIIYPTKEENTKLFHYCHSLEKILSRNSIKTRNNLPRKAKSISADIAKFGVSKTKGAFIKKAIDHYKKSKNDLIINFLPNELYCLIGYWIENIKPGSFESIFYEKSKSKIHELKDFKIEVDDFVNDFNSEYKIIKEEFNDFFK